MKNGPAQGNAIEDRLIILEYQIMENKADVLGNPEDMNKQI